MTHASEPEHVDPQPPPIDPVPSTVSTIRRGPGVIPPFVAPPREGVKRRRWIGVGIGVGIAVLCCGGGGAGLVGLLATVKDQRFSDAQTVVTKYMNDKTDGHYATAYQLLCEGLKDQYTLTEFTADIIDAPILNFQVDYPVARGSDLLVAVSVDYVSGATDSTEYEVVADADGSSRVCGGERF